ncbi:hypothetical protein CPB86DRAFT_776850 [Serendipita vermifera]|nr:hypothetical protein CPB86DRAFT_776850 [Serendipita vermifera]
MSAYGKLPPRSQPQRILLPTIYKLQPKPPRETATATMGVSNGHEQLYVSTASTVNDKDTPNANRSDWTHTVVYHLVLSTNTPQELVTCLYKEFADELERDENRTYPQEKGMSRDEFEAYFFARDVFVGVGMKVLEVEEKSLVGDDGELVVAKRWPTIEDARGERTWKDAISGFYYIKPNYPGHSSHICNAGFVIPHSRRGLGLGQLLGQSYLHYAPQLGYRGSIFNLVYADNPASMRIWDKLGFKRVGVVPGAGKRVRRKGEGKGGGGSGEGEEEEYYVDAHIIYKSFVEEK